MDLHGELYAMQLTDPVITDSVITDSVVTGPVIIGPATDCHVTGSPVTDRSAANRTVTVARGAHRERAAVLLEFAVSVAILLPIIYFFIDITLSYVRYNMLVFAAESVSRKMAVNLNINYGLQGVPDLEDMAETELGNFVASMGFDKSTLALATRKGGGGLSIDKDCSTTPPRCWLVMSEISWPSFSVASTQFPLFSMKATTRSLIEDNCMNCVCP